MINHLPPTIEVGLLARSGVRELFGVLGQGKQGPIGVKGVGRLEACLVPVAGHDYVHLPPCSQHGGGEELVGSLGEAGVPDQLVVWGSADGRRHRCRNQTARPRAEFW